MREKRTGVGGQGRSLQADSLAGVILPSEAPLTPEMRTAALFQQNAVTLAGILKPEEGAGMVIALPRSERRARILRVQPFPQVGSYYQKIQEMVAGDLWNPGKYDMAQSLVVTPSEGGFGSCVRILQVEYFDPATGEYRKKMEDERGTYNEREGAIARYLGLGKGEISQLRFLDDSAVLYIVRQADGIKSGLESERDIDSESADRMMRELLEE